MQWTYLILLTIVLWGMYDVMYDKVSSLFSPMFSFLSIAVIQVILFGLGFFFMEKGAGKPIMDKLPVLLLTAILPSGGNLAFYYAFKAGAPISIAVPIVTIGIAVLGGLWGIFVAKEPFTLSFVLGMVLSIAGIYLIGLKK